MNIILLLLYAEHVSLSVCVTFSPFFSALLFFFHGGNEIRSSFYQEPRRCGGEGNIASPKKTQLSRQPRGQCKLM